MEGNCPACHAYVEFNQYDLVRLECPRCGRDFSPEQLQGHLA